MLLFGHLGITIFLSTLIYLPIAFSAMGVLLPDIIDKLLFVNGSTICGRLIGHSVFFGPILSLTTFAITRKKNLSLAILFGAYMHLIEDLDAFLPLFFPFVNYNFTCRPVSISFTSLNIIAETVGVFFLIGMLVFRRTVLYFREYLWKSRGNYYAKKQRTTSGSI